MGTTDKSLAKMRTNPKGWHIEDLEAVAGRCNLRIRKPKGSHVVFSFPGVQGEASVPSHRPIKPVYVKKFVALVDAALAKEE
jgi:hypothetical protein